jgi:type I restriction enzyme, S subunit
MDEWKECLLGDVAIIVDCEHKTAPIVGNSDYISVRTSDIQNGRIDYENANRVSFETYLEWTKRLTPGEGDIILAREAPVGEVGYIHKDKKVCLGQRTVLIRANKETLNSRYLLYYLTSEPLKNDLISRSTGSVVEHLNVKDIKLFDIRIHESLEQQQTIASVLSSLDDKIELLHRQNKTLEALAETLFRQWFVEEAEERWEEKSLYDVIELGNDAQ